MRLTDIRRALEAWTGTFRGARLHMLDNEGDQEVDYLPSWDGC